MATKTFSITGVKTTPSFWTAAGWSGGTLPAVGDSLLFALPAPTFDLGIMSVTVDSNFAHPNLVAGTGTVTWTLPDQIGQQSPFSLINTSQIWINTSTASYSTVGSGSFTLQTYTASAGTATSTFVNSGAIEIMGGTAAITNTGVQGTGRIDLFNTATLTVTGIVGGGQTINFMGTQEVLNLNTPSYFAGAIAGFQNGDTIDLVGITGATMAVVNGQAVVSGGSGNGVNISSRRRSTRLQASPISLGLHRSRFALRAWLLCGTRRRGFHERSPYELLILECRRAIPA